MNESKAELLSELRELINSEVRGGFASRRDIVDTAIDYGLGQDMPIDELKAFAEKETDIYLQAHYVLQKYWPAETNCDRLDEAFAALDRVGIIARHNFTCYQTCGHSEIADCVDERSRGYVFYHQQDTGSVVRNDYLYLAYGAISGKEEESLAIGHEICDTLRQHGLEPDWNGSVRTRICLRDLNWQRRRIKELDYDETL